MEMPVFHRFRDGEEVTFWDPVISTVQGSLAEERRKSTGRRGKDVKEYRLVQKLNRQNRLSLYSIFSEPSTSENSLECEPKGVSQIENRLSHLGASYPNISGLGVYVVGLQKLEQETFKTSKGKTKRIGPQSGKKIFNLLFWISSKPDLACCWKFLILTKIGKLVLNQNIQGKWMQNSTTILTMLGLNEVAYCWGCELLQNKSAINDALKQGEKLSKKIFIQFYENTNPYRSKVRRRGYARSSPVRPGSSKNEILEANTSEEALLKDGVLREVEEGGYEMTNQKIDTEELLYRIFSNSLEAFEAKQGEAMERLGIRRPERTLSSNAKQLEDEESKKLSNQT